jgi:glycyl-tRNA synthetase beta chain
MTAASNDLLIEIGTEELPPKALKSLMESFASQVVAGLEHAGIAHGGHRAFATPRRLAVRVADVAHSQPERTVERKGPALQAAYDSEGRPTKAAEGFARSCGVGVDALQRLETEKGSWLAYRGVKEGEATAALLPGIVDQALSRLPIPKRMRWGDSEAEFVRPVHWVVLLHGTEVVPATVLGIESGRVTRGHRFHGDGSIELDEPREYETRLREAGYVIADFGERMRYIEKHVIQQAEALGGRAVIEPELLEEVSALVEWPVPVAGGFDPDFLRVPAEALVSSMQEHQRYFPVRDNDERLMPHFIAVANIESREPAKVVAGNERVIRPRLADAAFFWDQDRKHSLASRVDSLRSVVFQKRLGSLHDKSARVAALGARFADAFEVDVEQIQRAAWLAKTDLMTEMVGEFPELQGLMGRYYAEEDGEPAAVAQALDEVYKPRFAGDDVAHSPLGQLLAVVERADTLVSIFAIGKAPTGAKDPFALRRAALGLLRTCLDSGRYLDLRALFRAAAAELPDGVDGVSQVEPVFEFCMDRLRGHYQERGIPLELFEAVRGVEEAGILVSDPTDFRRRLEACQRFATLPESSSLAAANKRIRNILRKADDGAVAEHVDPDRFQQEEERVLYEAVNELRAEVEDRVSAGEYTEALQRLASLKEPVDRFFDGVLVMADEPVVRGNRLGLLHRVSELFLQIADVSRLPAGE